MKGNLSLSQREIPCFFDRINEMRPSFLHKHCKSVTFFRHSKLFSSSFYFFTKTLRIRFSFSIKYQCYVVCIFYNSNFLCRIFSKNLISILIFKYSHSFLILKLFERAIYPSYTLKFFRFINSVSKQQTMRRCFTSFFL